MKKTIAIVLAAVLLLSFVACGSSITKEQIVGTWKVTAAKGSDAENLIGANLHFMSGGTYSWTLNGIIALTGQYRLSGNRLYFDNDYTDISLNGDTMTLRDSTSEITLVKQ
ncbi:MAG: hypothetical protein IKZ44_06055 [Clostridia bacterium]|nr:hypothetical protein [Clostridia bacterium]